MRSVPPLLCIVGPSGAGKTRLLERLVPALIAGGVRPAVLKHCTHLVPPAGRDSARLAAAGGAPAIAVSADAVELRALPREPLPAELAWAFCAEADLVLAEGWRDSPYDKILVASADGAESLCGVRLVCRAGDAPPADWVRDWLAARRGMRQDVAGVVLIGGAGRRMGRDKALLEVRGGRVLHRLCELLADRTGRVLCVGGPEAGRDLPLFVQHEGDLAPGQGPLGGILTALVRLNGGEAIGVCVVACDMPAVSGELLDLLLTARDRACDATVARHPQTGKIEPLFAIYEPRAVASLGEAVQARQLSLTRWLETACVRWLDVPPRLAEHLANVNTPADLEALRRAGMETT